MYRLRGQHAQSAMAMAGVLREKERAKVGLRLLRVGKAARVGGRVFDGFELALRIGVVVGRSRAAVAGQDIEIDQQLREGLGRHRRAPVLVQGQLPRLDGLLAAGGPDQAPCAASAFGTAGARQTLKEGNQPRQDHGYVP